MRRQDNHYTHMRVAGEHTPAEETRIPGTKDTRDLVGSHNFVVDSPQTADLAHCPAILVGTRDTEDMQDDSEAPRMDATPMNQIHARGA